MNSDSSVQDRFAVLVNARGPLRVGNLGATEANRILDAGDGVVVRTCIHDRLESEFMGEVDSAGDVENRRAREPCFPQHPIGFSRTQVSYSKRPPGVDQDREAILDWLSQRADHGTGSPFEQTTAE